MSLSRGRVYDETVSQPLLPILIQVFVFVFVFVSIIRPRCNSMGIILNVAVVLVCP